MHRLNAQRRLADALSEIVRRTVPAPEQAHGAQEALDVVAAMAGLKPIALLGQGCDWPQWLDGVAEITAIFGGTAVAGTAWVVPGDVDGLPDWYADPMQAAQRGHTSLLVGWSNCSAYPEAGTLTEAEEARLLGYPPCCVADHHVRQRVYHRLMTELIHRQSGGDELQIRRLAESEVVLRPRTAEEWRRWHMATRLVPAPYTSVNMCEACAANSNSPARTLSLHYRRFAHESGIGDVFGRAAA